MSEQLPIPSSQNTFERIKRLNAQGNECWSARDLARVLEYSVFRNFQPVIERAKEACSKSGHAIADHFAEMRNMVGIGSGAQRLKAEQKKALQIPPASERENQS